MSLHASYHTVQCYTTPGGSAAQASQSMAACQEAAPLSCQGTSCLPAQPRPQDSLPAAHCRWRCCWPSCSDHLTLRAAGTAGLSGVWGSRQAATKKQRQKLAHEVKEATAAGEAAGITGTTALQPASVQHVCCLQRENMLYPNYSNCSCMQTYTVQQSACRHTVCWAVGVMHASPTMSQLSTCQGCAARVM